MSGLKILKIKRSVFYSFHFQQDNWRASQVRNIGVVEGNAPARDNDWEQVKKRGNAAIQNWIDGQLKGRSCTIVLIGADTAGRKWINYEVEKTWADRKGLLGINIHNLKDGNGRSARKGANPFDEFTLGSNKTPLSNIVKTYNPLFQDSQQSYRYISQNLSNWIEEAIRIRRKYD